MPDTTLPTRARACRAVLASGAACSSIPLRRSEWCYFHSPDLHALRAISRARGTEAAALKRTTRAYDLTTERGVVAFQTSVLDRLLSAPMGSSEARAAVEIARLIHDGSMALTKGKRETLSPGGRRLLGGGGGESPRAEGYRDSERTQGSAEPSGAASEQIQVVEVPGGEKAGTAAGTPL